MTQYTPLTTISVPAGTIAASGNWQSPAVRNTGGPISTTATINQAGTLAILRFSDIAGTHQVGSNTSAMVANTAATVAVNDTVGYAAFAVKITNSATSVATVNALSHTSNNNTVEYQGRHNELMISENSAALYNYGSVVI